MDGSHLADLLLEKGYEIFGLERPTSSPIRTNTAHLAGKITYIRGDLTDQSSLVRALKESDPDEVYNLGGQSSVGESFIAPEYAAEVNGIGVLRLLEAIRDYNIGIRTYQASSSEMFGNFPQDPQTEMTPLYPRSPYGASKVFGHCISKNYRDAYNMFICCGILFNHESERRGHKYVTRKITDGVARISLGLADTIFLGNLEARRDWGYAPDYVEAMWSMLQQDRHRFIEEQRGDFVIATNECRSVRDFLVEAFLAVGIRDWQRYVGHDARFERPTEVYASRGDFSKAKRVLNWSPKTSFSEMVRKMVTYDVESLSDRKHLLPN